MTSELVYLYTFLCILLDLVFVCNLRQVSQHLYESGIWCKMKLRVIFHLSRGLQEQSLNIKKG